MLNLVAARSRKRKQPPPPPPGFREVSLQGLLNKRPALEPERLACALDDYPASGSPPILPGVRLRYMTLRNAAIETEAEAGGRKNAPCSTIGKQLAWMDRRGRPVGYGHVNSTPIPFVFRPWSYYVQKNWNKADAYMYTTVGERAVREHLPSDLARLVGAFVSDGHDFQDGL